MQFDPKCKLFNRFFLVVPVFLSAFNPSLKASFFVLGSSNCLYQFVSLAADWYRP